MLFYAYNLSESRILNGENVETSTYTYDYKNRLIEKTEPFTQEENRITKYKYDRKDNLISETVIQNEQEITKAFKYDGLDRVIWEMDPLPNITRYKYDANDNIIKKVNPNEIGMSIEEAPGAEFEYDSLNRNTKKVFRHYGTILNVIGILWMIPLILELPIL